MVNLRRKKRSMWLALLWALCVVFALFSNVPKVHATGTGSFYGSTNYAEAGGTVTINFSISDNPGIWGLKGSVSYDSSVLTLTSVSAGSIFSDSEFVLPDLNQQPFTFLATGSGINNKTGNGVVIKLTFTVSSSAKLAGYPVNINIDQAINVDEQDVSISTSAAKIVVVSCLHSKTYLTNAIPATETSEGYSGDTYCVKCDALVKKGSKTPMLVNTCEHKDAEWRIIQEAACEVDGKKELICDDCNKHLEEQVLPKTNHAKTVLVDQKAATTTEDGYTGDVCCVDCNAILQKGTVIPKIPILVFNMTTQVEDTYYKESQAGLVFVSEAELDTFVRVEINGIILDKQSYTLESGSTKITLKPEYLATLSDGKYTITIVSNAGTASAQFRVAQKPIEQPKNVFQDNPMLIITILSVVVAVACLAYTIISGIRRNTKGRFSYHGEEEYEDDQEDYDEEDDEEES